MTEAKTKVKTEGDAEILAGLTNQVGSTWPGQTKSTVFPNPPRSAQEDDKKLYSSETCTKSYSARIGRNETMLETRKWLSVY